MKTKFLRVALRNASKWLKHHRGLLLVALFATGALCQPLYAADVEFSFQVGNTPNSIELLYSGDPSPAIETVYAIPYASYDAPPSGYTVVGWEVDGSVGGLEVCGGVKPVGGPLCSPDGPVQSFFFLTPGIFTVSGSIGGGCEYYDFDDGGILPCTNFSFGAEAYVDFEIPYASQVDLTQVTPSPPALPLFATGLGVMGLFGWRRKRKNAAAIAAA